MEGGTGVQNRDWNKKQLRNGSARENYQLRT